MNATGVRLWNPDWRQSATASINQEFIDHVVELLLSEEEHKDEDKVSTFQYASLHIIADVRSAFTFDFAIRKVQEDGDDLLQQHCPALEE